MAAVLEPKDTAAKHNSQVDEQIAQATSRIRAHDLTFGGLTLAALVLGYATAMILLDKYFALAPWVRQASFVGFLAAFAGTAYVTLFRPLRLRINPLYAAKQVEGTLDDPKNSVTGYVDAREKGDLNATVKAALASRAAKAAAEADVNRAINHRSLVWLSGVAIALLLALIVLFFVFRPTQFASLANRAFLPFSAGKIESRTQLELVKPEPADPTITTGQSVTVAVTVKGKVPAADGPDKVRLLVRQSQSDPNYDELPMAQGATSRDYELRVPDHLVNNGFWYKVVGGDAETPEHKVTVRTLPRFDTFTVGYEYPAYLRLPPFTNTDPVIKAPRGTIVTLLAKGNRQVRDGLMVVEPSNQKVNGTPDVSDPNTLKFVFKLTETGRYKLTFNATNGERTADPFTGVITVEGDRSPDVIITAPEPDETEQPANGIQKIEGKIGDDYGIDTVTLKMRTLGATGRQLPDAPLLNVKIPSFLRADGTHPTDIDYKGSIDFATIKKDAAGLPVELTPGTVVEYWLEATDNCTEPKPNVGVSNKKTVRLGAPKTEPEEKKQLDDQKQKRQDEEKQHNDNQQKKLDNENRDRRGEPKDKDGKKDEGKKGDNAQPQNPPSDPPMGPKDGKPEGKDGMSGMGMDSNPMPMSDPKTDTKPDPNNKGADNKDAGNKGGNSNDVDRTAQELQKELDRENQTGALEKPNNTPPPDGERPEPSKSKPQPQAGAKGGDNAEQKPDAKADPMNTEGQPGTGKPPSEPQKPEDPSAPKPEPKGTDPMGGKPDAKPGDNRGQQTGAPAGTDKQPPKEPAAKQPEGKNDPNSGAASKPTEPKPGEANGTDGKSEPKPAGSKPNPAQPPQGGADKPTDASKPQPKGPNDKGVDPKGATPEAGDSKPNQSPAAGGAKPQPKGGEQPKGQDSDTKPAGGANDPKQPNETPAADAKPAADGKKGDAGAKPQDAGGDKPLPKDAGDKGTPNGGTAPQPKEKMDPEKLKELQNAAKDLAGNDEAKKQAARDKLDKEIGKDKREELEKLGNDLNSKDDKTRQAAEQKVKDAMEKAKGDGADAKKDDTNPPKSGTGEPKKDQPGAGGPKGDAPKLTDEQKKDIEKAVNDLQSGDPKKQQEARDKLDKMVGEENRKDAEQLMKDLKSDDKEKQQAAQKKLDDLRKKMEDQPKKGGAEKTDGSGGTNDAKGKDPSPEELADLAKKAQDLQSPDPHTRDKAQRELDNKIGKEQRQKLEEALKNQKSGDPKRDADNLKRQLEDMTKGRNKKDDPRTNGGPGSPPVNKPMEDDAANRRKSAELTLENLKNEDNRKKLQDKKGWTDAEYDKFLKDYEKFVDGLRDKEREELKPATAPMPKDPSNPLTAGGAAKVEGTGGASGAAGVGGPTAPPPGFEGARNKFQDALKKKP